MDDIGKFLDFFKTAVGILHGVGSLPKIILLAVILAITVGWIGIAAVLELLTKVKEKHEGLVKAETRYPRVFRVLYSGKVRAFLLVIVILLLAIDWRDATTISPPELKEIAPPSVEVTFITGSQQKAPAAASSTAPHPNRALQQTQPAAAAPPPPSSGLSSPPLNGLRAPIYGRTQQAFLMFNAFVQGYLYQINMAEINRNHTVNGPIGMPNGITPVPPYIKEDPQKVKQEKEDAQRRIALADKVLKEEYRRIDERASDWLRDNQSGLVSLHAEAIAHMKENPPQLTVDQADTDQTAFSEALKAAQAETPLADLEESHINKNRFQPLSNYLEQLVARLRKYPDT